MANTHGLRMAGLKEAAAATKGLSRGCGWHVQVSYDTEDGAILTSEHTGDSWTQYDSKSIVGVARIETPATMQEIADMIRKAAYERGIEVDA